MDYDASVSKTTLTLSAAVPVAPTAADKIFAACPGTVAIATALLAVIDALGPSRADTTADPSDVWEDTAYISNLTAAARDTTDTDGITKFARSIPVGGLTINGTAADVTGLGDIAGSPELFIASSIRVVQVQ